MKTAPRENYFKVKEQNKKKTADICCVEGGWQVQSEKEFLSFNQRQIDWNGFWTVYQRRLMLFWFIWPRSFKYQWHYWQLKRKGFCILYTFWKAKVNGLIKKNKNKLFIIMILIIKLFSHFILKLVTQIRNKQNKSDTKLSILL